MKTNTCLRDCCLRILCGVFIVSSFSCGRKDEPDIVLLDQSTKEGSDLDSSKDVSQEESAPTEERKRPGIQYHHMLILGDSISVGVLSETTHGSNIRVSVNASMATLAVSNKTTLSLSLDRLINNNLSINSNYVLQKLHELQSQYKMQPSAFYGGTDFPEDKYSLATLLGLQSSQVFHAGVSGFKSGNVLNASLPEALDIANDFDLVVLEIGSNDFCSQEDPVKLQSNFRRNISGILDKLSDLPSLVHIVVVPIPDIPEILAPIAQNSVLTIDLDSFGKQSLKCQDLQKRYCPRITENPADMAGLRLSLNEIIIEEVSTHNSKGGPQATVVKSISLAETFTEDALSVDCFHPGSVGHKILGQEVFLELQKLH
jgi:hypothetical protein